MYSPEAIQLSNHGLESFISTIPFPFSLPLIKIIPPQISIEQLRPPSG